MFSRNKTKKKFADYVLSWMPGTPVAVVEAKDKNHPVSHGMQQALGYAEILRVPSALSSNGDGFASHNKKPAAGEDIEKKSMPRQFDNILNVLSTLPWVASIITAVFVYTIMPSCCQR